MFIMVPGMLEITTMHLWSCAWTVDQYFGQPVCQHTAVSQDQISDICTQKNTTVKAMQINLT